MTPQPFTFCDHEFLADPSGALIWPSQDLIVFSDLHFGKGNALAAHADALLPPYDGTETLNVIVDAIQRTGVKSVISLGDSFDRADIGLNPTDLDRLDRVTQQTTWTWVLGNHDPTLPHNLAGKVVDEVSVAGVVFRHEASKVPQTPEISGHYHPKAAIRVGGRRIRARCFVYVDMRLILPAFGTYTGGLDVTDAALQRLIGADPNLMLCHGDGVYPVAAAALCD